MVSTSGPEGLILSLLELPFHTSRAESPAKLMTGSGKQPVKHKTGRKTNSMKLIKTLSLVACTLALLVSASLAAEDKKEAKKPCCEAKVEAEKKCEHACCKKAAEESKICTKCHKEKTEDKK